MKFDLMKYTLAFIATAILSVGVAHSGIETEFKSITIKEENYRTIESSGGVWLRASDFVNYPAESEDRDDGYYEYDLPWTFSYAGIETDKIWICVNGFVTFKQPLNLPQRNPIGLFTDDDATYQEAIAAPFWGDHYYRTVNDAGYEPSKVLVQDNDDYVIIEWKDLNVNSKTTPSSVANFQMKIWRSTEPTTTLQGDIEFAYGLVNGASGSTVYTDGAGIGLKGTGDDYLNGLCFYDEDLGTHPYCDERTVSTELSDVWQPSGGTNKRIFFSSNPVINILSAWGDGDTDLSHGFGGRHFDFPQNRFVTFNDVRMVMRSVTSHIPLDSVLGRQAFHADTDHDGRFAYLDTNIWEQNAQGQYLDDQGRTVEVVYEFDGDDIDEVLFIDQDNVTYTWDFDQQDGLEDDRDQVLVEFEVPVKRTVRVRSRNWQEDVPSEIPSLNQLYFEADENDARWIVSYLGAKVPTLPWIYDTTIEKGKFSNIEPIANDIKFGEALKQGNNEYKIPVFVNGLAENGVSARIELDADVENVEVLGNGEFNLYDHVNGNVVIVTDGSYTSDDAVAYIYVNTDNANINASNLRLNDVDLNNRNITVENDEVFESMTASPNPFTVNTTISFNIAQKGNYRLAVYDQMGNLVKVLFDGERNVGANQKEIWNGTDMNNSPVAAGVYIYRLTGANVSESSKIVLSK